MCSVRQPVNVHSFQRKRRPHQHLSTSAGLHDQFGVAAATLRRSRSRLRFPAVLPTLWRGFKARKGAYLCVRPRFTDSDSVVGLARSEHRGSSTRGEGPLVLYPALHYISLHTTALCICCSLMHRISHHGLWPRRCEMVIVGSYYRLSCSVGGNDVLPWRKALCDETLARSVAG